MGGGGIMGGGKGGQKFKYSTKNHSTKNKYSFTL